MKTISKLALAGVVALGTMGGYQAYAHHSAAMFDDSIDKILTGTVTRFDYVNPHSWLYIDAVNEDGTTTAWGFELAAPPRLQRQGVSPTFWQPGDVVTVKTHPLRDGRPAGDLAGAITADGKEFGNIEGLTAPTADAAAGATTEGAAEGAGEEAELAAPAPATP